MSSHHTSPATYLVRALLGSALLVLVSCGGHSPIECPVGTPDYCNVHPGGMCLPSPSGGTYCAYPSTSCSSGMAWGEGSPDDIRGQCVALPDGGPDAGPMFDTLKIHKIGDGDGTVTSTPVGISCGASCSATYPLHTHVALDATAEAGSVFLGWAGRGCMGTGSCTVDLDGSSHDEVTALFSVPANGRWLDQIGGTAADRAYAVVVDATGNVYVTGEFTGTISLLGQTLTSAGDRDVYVAKVANATGDRVWATQYGGLNGDLGTAIALDSAGNVIVGGGYNASPSGSQGCFVAKFANSDGALIWDQHFQGAGAVVIQSVAIDSDDVIAAGSFSQSLSLGPTISVTSNGGVDALVLKFAGADGAPLWAHNYGSAGHATVFMNMTVDTSGNIIAVGEFSGSVNFGAVPPLATTPGVPGAPDTDAVLAKYQGSDGSMLFAKRFGGPARDRATAVATDSTGNIYVAGVFASSSVNLGGTDLQRGMGDSDMFLVQFSAGGAHQWSERFDGTSQADTHSLHVDRDANLLATGSFYGHVNLGGMDLTSADNQEIWIAKFTAPAGVHVWSLRLGGVGTDYGLGITGDATGNVFATGYFSQFADFHGHALTSAGGEDGFVISLGP